MAEDRAFPDPRSTAPTTTTTTVRSPPLTVHMAYVCSPLGKLRIIQIVAGLIYWILLSLCCCYLGLPLVLTLITWVATIILFIIFAVQLNQRVTTINWVLTEMLQDLGSALFLFIAGCFTTARAAEFFHYVGNTRGCTGFAVFLGFTLTVMYGLSAFRNVRIIQSRGGWRGLRQGESGSPGATTPVVTATDYAMDTRLLAAPHPP